MKLLGTILCIVLGATSGFAQSTSPTAGPANNTPFVYGEAGIGVGNYTTGKIGLNVIFDHDNILSFSFAQSGRRASDIPAGYEPGMLGSFPNQTLNTIALCYGKVLYTGRPGVRYILKGGLAAGFFSTPENFVQEGSSGWFGSNYRYSTNNQFLEGLVLNPTIEFPLTRHFCFAFGAYTHINAFSSVFGLEGSLLFGKVRNRKPPVTDNGKQ